MRCMHTLALQLVQKIRKLDNLNARDLHSSVSIGSAVTVLKQLACHDKPGGKITSKSEYSILEEFPQADKFC
jgi:hypothetical protein